MKRLGYTMAFTLALATLAPAVQAMEAKATHLHSSAALPRNARVPFATYRLRVHVESIPLTQLAINLPGPLSLKRGIAVVDQTGQAVSAVLTVNANMATITFAQPVPPDTILSIDLNGVSNLDDSGHTWFLSVSSRSAGLNGAIALGFARIQTSK
jgi:hypothetical protein